MSREWVLETVISSAGQLEVATGPPKVPLGVATLFMMGMETWELQRPHKKAARGAPQCSAQRGLREKAG